MIHLPLRNSTSSRRTTYLLPFLGVLLWMAAYHEAAADTFVCNAPQILSFRIGGSLASTAGAGSCIFEDNPPISSYIWNFTYSSVGPWAGAVGSNCDGSQPPGHNDVVWFSPYECNANHDICMDASINGGSPVQAASIHAHCTDPPPPDNTCCTGHPVRPGEGEKVFVENDLQIGALQLTRHYSSYGPRTPARLAPGLLGQFWRTNYDRNVYAVPGSPGIVAMAVRPDSRVKYFDSSGHETLHYSGKAADTLIATSSGWTYTTGNDEIETYDSNGRLIGLWDKDKLQQTLSYDSQGRLAQVSDAHGRSLTFAYSGDIYGLHGGSVTATAPDGTSITYAVNGISNLTSVTYPGGATRQFIYDDPNLQNALTQITDENGTPYERVEYYDSVSSPGTLQPNFGYASASYLAPGIAGNTIERNSFVYNSDGTTTHTDPLGATQTMTFSSATGVLNMLTLSAPCSSCNTGTVQSWSYDAAGYLNGTTDFNNRTTSYTFDDARGLENTRIEASGTTAQRTISTTWDATFHMPDLLTVSNASGAVESMTKWTYNTRGQPTARCQVDPAVSGATSYTCGSSTNAPTGVRQWTYTYCDTAGAVCPLVGLLLSLNGPRTDIADVTTYAYYNSTDLSGCATLGGTCHTIGDLQSVTNALGQVTTYVSYDRNGRVTRLKDVNGVYTDLTYHPRGWLLTRTVRANTNGTPNSTLDATTTFTYDNVGNVTKVTQPDGTFLSYTYDNAHRLTDIADSAGSGGGNHIHYTLDAAGNRIDEKSIDPNGTLKRELSRTYDQLNRLTAVLNSAGANVQNHVNPAEAPPTGITYTDGYDGDGNAIYSIDGTANHVGTEQQYDPLNRLVKTLQDHAGTGATRDTSTQYAYDARDNLRSVTDPDGLVTSYTYDGLSNLTNLSSPDTGNANYTYDAAGNRATQTDARGIVSTYGYDALNRLTTIVYPTSSLNITYTYDQPASGCYNVGRLTTITDHAGTTTYCYDLRGNVVKKTQITADLSLNLVSQYQYTLADRLQSITYPSGIIVTYVRDNVGRVASVTYKQSATGTSNNVITGLTYYPFGPQNVITFANGRTLTKTYDADYAIDKVVSSNASGLVIDGSVDVLGNLINASSTVGANPATQQYQYDPLYRLSGVQNGSGTSLEAFTYGPTGDRLSKTLQGQSTQTYGYSAGTHHLSSVAGASRSFDPNGNTTQINGSTLTYDNRNRLVGQGTTTFDYNGRGERVAKVTAILSQTNGGLVGPRAFFYNENGMLLSEWAQVWVCGSGGATQGGTTGKELHANRAVGSGSQATSIGVQQCSDPNQVLINTWKLAAEYLYVDSVPVGLYLPPTGTQIHGTLYYVETDQLGTPRQVIMPGATTANDTTVWKWDYFANNSTFGENAPSVQTIAFNLRFPGQYYDTETGLNYNYFRDYEPGTGRYVESDPIGLYGGINTYGYALGSPLNFVDPIGLQSVCRMALTGVGAVLGGAAGYSCGCLIGGIIGGGGGTLVAPGVGTLGGAGAGCGAGGGWAGAGGAAAGGAAGNAAANAVCDDDKCPPCKLLDGTEVPVGTIAFRPLETPATIQHGISGPHYNIYKANQAPRDSSKPCYCFWQRMDAVPPAGLPPGAIPIQPFAN